MRVRFTVDLAPDSNWGMNKIYAGTHWDERKQQAQQVHLLVHTAIREQMDRRKANAKAESAAFIVKLLKGD